MATTFPMSNPWVDLEALNAAKMQARVTTPINDLASSAAIAIANSRMQATQTPGGTAIPTAGFGAVTGYAIDLDTFGSSFNATTGVWTCPAGGQYELSGQLSIVSGTARLIAAFTKNGVTTVLYSSFLTGTTSTAATAVLPTKEFTLAPGDTIQLAGNSTTATTTSAANVNNSFMRIKRVG